MRLTELKEYTQGALKKVTNDVFSMMLQAEMMFRGIDEQVLLAQKDLKAVLVCQAEENCTQIFLPTCHDVRKIILSRYFDVRVMIYCREANSKKKVENSSNRGSKSAAMKSIVKKIK